MIENSPQPNELRSYYREAVTNIYEDQDYRGRRPARNVPPQALTFIEDIPLDSCPEQTQPELQVMKPVNEKAPQPVNTLMWPWCCVGFVLIDPKYNIKPQLGCITTGFLVLTNGFGLPEDLRPEHVRFVSAIDNKKGIPKKVIGISRYNGIAVLDLGESYESSTIDGNVAVQFNPYRGNPLICKFDQGKLFLRRCIWREDGWPLFYRGSPLFENNCITGVMIGQKDSQIRPVVLDKNYKVWANKQRNFQRHRGIIDICTHIHNTEQRQVSPSLLKSLSLNNLPNLTRLWLSKKFFSLRQLRTRWSFNADYCQRTLVKSSFSVNLYKLSHTAHNRIGDEGVKYLVRTYWPNMAALYLSTFRKLSLRATILEMRASNSFVEERYGLI